MPSVSRHSRPAVALAERYPAVALAEGSESTRQPP